MRLTSFTHVMGPSGPVSFGTEAEGLRSSRYYRLALLRAALTRGIRLIGFESSRRRSSASSWLRRPRRAWVSVYAA
jgi:hypothetical protein